MHDTAGNKHNVLLTNSTPSKRNLNHDGKKQNQKPYAGLTVEPSGGRRNDFAIKHRGTSGLPCQRRPRSPASGIFLQGHCIQECPCVHTHFFLHKSRTSRQSLPCTPGSELPLGDGPFRIGTYRSAAAQPTPLQCPGAAGPTHPTAS